MGYKFKAFQGFSGQTVIQVLSAVITLAKVAVLARLLNPSDFGLFSLVTIALGLTEAFTETGVNTTIIQSHRPVKFFVNSAWVIAICRGFIIGGIMIALGWVMSLYYSRPFLWPLIILSASIPVIKGFINPAIIELYKELSFIADSVYQISLLVVGSLAAVILVLLHPTVVAWIASLIIAALFEVLISFAFFKIRPRFKYEAESGKIIFSQVKVLSINSVLSYLTLNADNLIVGKVIGEFGLGLYQPTYSLTHQANYNLSQSIYYGTLPIYTKIVDDKQRLQRAFRKTALVTLGIMALASLPLLLFPQLIIGVILGSKWHGAIELVPWLTLAGLINGSALIGYTLLVARKKIHLMNWHMALNLLFLVIFVYWGGVHYGLLGAVIGVLVSRIVAWPMIAYATWKELQAND